MALGARELVLILRATNQASGPIRQVARDLQTLGSGGARAARGVDALADKRRWARMGAASAILRDVSRSTRLVGIGVGAGLGFAATAAAKFQTQAGLVATQTGDMNLSIGRTTQQMQKNAKMIETGVLRQMNKFPASAQEMNDALYEIYSSTELGSQGIKGVNNGLKLLNLMNRASVAGQVDLSEVTKASTSVMNAFGGGVEAMPKRLQRMFAAVRFGRMTFADFVGTFSQIVPATQAADQSFDTMTGTMAALTRLMPNVRVSATAYARMLEIFGRKKFVDGAKKFGVEMQDAQGHLRPLPQILDDFRVAINKLPLKEQAPMIRNFFKALSNQEGTIQARRAFVALIKHPELYRKVLKQTVEDNNEFTKSFRLMADTAGVKWETFVNRMRATFIKLGAAAIPILMQLTEPLQKAANWFMKLDAATQKMIVNWAAIGSVIAILGGTLGALVGHLGTFLAAFRVPPIAFLATITAISAALLILTGHGDMVKDAIYDMFSAGLSSAKAFLAMLGLITVGVLKLRGALLSAVAAQRASMAMGAAGAGGGGLLAMLGGAGGRGREAFGKRRIEFFDRNAGKYAQKNLSLAARSGAALKASLLGGSLAAGGIASGLLPVVGIVAAIAGGVFLWQRHQQKAREDAERFAAIQAKFRQFAQAPLRAAQGAAQFGLDVRDARRAELSVQAVNIQIKNMRAQLKGARAEDRPGIMNQINMLMLDRADAMDAVSKANAKANASWGQMTNFIQGTINNLGRMTEQETRLNQMQARRAALQARVETVPMGRADLQRTLLEIERLDKGIKGTQASMTGLRVTTAQAAVTMRTSFTKSVTDMMKAGMLPRAGQQAIDNMLVAFTTMRKRMPSLKEARIFLRAELDPAALGKVDKDLQKFVGQSQRKHQIKLGHAFAVDSGQIKGAAKQAEKVPSPLKLPIGLQPPKDNGKSVKAKIAATFKVASKHSVQVVPPPAGTLHQIGATITAGVEAGITPVHQTVIRDMIQGTVKGMEKEGRGGSPMMLFAEKVGKPIVQGIIVGLNKNAKYAAEAAIFVIDTIEGKTVAKMTQFLNKQASLFRQMNSNLSALVARGVPMKLVEQLASMGKDGAKQIAKLASASKTELNKFVAAWSRANAAVAQSGKFNWAKYVETVESAGQKLMDLYKEMQSNLHDHLMSQLTAMDGFGRQVGDSVAGAFGEIFQGPMNISEHIGPAFDEAMASYSSSMSDLQGQMEELQQRQADTIADFMKRRRDELKSAFGQLFSGPILSAGFAAGSIRDLQADLEQQLKTFNDWRSNLDRLSARGLPKQLMKDLEALGPDASQNLALLANASDEELNKYVATWQGAQARIEEVTQATFMDQEGFAEAMADIAKQMADIARQMSNLTVPQKATFGTLLADLNAQKAAWTDYNNILTGLQARGVPGGLLAQLAALGVDGVEILRLMNTGTDAELAEFIRIWTEKEGQLKTAKQKWQDTLAPEDIMTTMHENRDALREFDTLLEKLGQMGVPQALIVELRKMGLDALPLIRGLAQMSKDELINNPDSFVNTWNETHTLINDASQQFITDQMTLWRGHGKNIATSLIAGVMDESPQLLAFFKNLFKNMLDAALKETKSHSPSQVYYDLGVNIVQGFQQGLDSMTTKLKTPQAPTIGRGTVSGGLLAQGGGGIQMTVNAHHSESLSTTLERASFRMRQRRVA